jgi:hypothetical protein
MIAITITRKPLSEGTVATNVLKHGCGAINIDRSRVGTGQVKQQTAGNRIVHWEVGGGACTYEKGTGARFTTEGRWPANLILTEGVVVDVLDQSVGWPQPPGNKKPVDFKQGADTYQVNYPGLVQRLYSDAGYVSRYFKRVGVPE